MEDCIIAVRNASDEELGDKVNRAGRKLACAEGAEEMVFAPSALFYQRIGQEILPERLQEENISSLSYLFI